MVGMETLLTWHGCINFIVHYKLGELGETLRGNTELSHRRIYAR